MRYALLVILLTFNLISAWRMSVRRTSAAIAVSSALTLNPLVGNSAIFISPSSLPVALFNDEGEWIDAEEGTWQETWGARAEKASKMSRRDIFMAAKGAPKWDGSRGEESLKSKKRRAMAACSAPEYLDMLKVTKRECTQRAMNGQTSEILKLIDEN
jgi:hypothetical protein